MSVHVCREVVFFDGPVRTQGTRIWSLAGVGSDMRSQVGGNGCGIRAEGALELSRGRGLSFVTGEGMFLPPLASAHATSELFNLQIHLQRILFLLITPQIYKTTECCK